MSWPPMLDELKVDRGIDQGDVRDDARLAVQLNAAVAFVERVHTGRFNFTDDLSSELPTPTAEIELGTLRLAYRWFKRGDSPDGLVAMGDLGSSQIPGFDLDIERMLEIGRYGGSVIV